MVSITVALVAGVTWITAIIVWGVTQSDSQRAVTVAEENRSCTASANVLAGIQLVPYKLRVVDVQDVVPTLENAYNVHVRFFETDYRTTDRFSLVPGKDDRTFTGETNWMSASLSAFRGASESCAAFSSLITGMMGGNKRVSTPSPETASIFGTSSSSY